MIGIFHGLLTLFSVGVNNVNNSIQDNKNRDMAEKTGQLTYRGARGGEFLVSNGRQVNRTTFAGHDVLRDMYNGQIYHDFTKDRLDEIKETARKERKTVYRVDEPRYSNLGVKSCYLDIKTDRPVGQLMINYHTFYVDLDTGYLLRLTDEMKQFMKQAKYQESLKYQVLDPNEIISFFNKRQERLKKCKEYGNNVSWMKHVFLLKSHDYVAYKQTMNKNGELDTRVFHLLNEYDLNTGEII